MLKFKTPKLCNTLSSVTNFFRREDGTGAVEAVIILPLLVLMYGASFVWFDAFRHNTLSLKATYVVSDILSRDSAVNHNYMDRLRDLIQTLVPGQDHVDMRITLIHFDKREDDDPADFSEHRLVWSYSPENGMTPLKQTDIDRDSSWIPLMSDDDSLVVTDTRISYTPVLRFVWGEAQIWENSLPTRPRFSSTLLNSDQPEAHKDFENDQDLEDVDDVDNTSVVASN